MKNKKRQKIRPTIKELEVELQREEKREKKKRILRSMVYLFIVVAAITMIVSTKVLPILRIYGSSMEPTLQSGDVVVAFKTNELHKNDIVAFYYNNKILVKRVIATQGDLVDIDEEGNVKVNGMLIEEPYVLQPKAGECDIELPYQVPEEHVFVMGDHRLISVDSRSVSMGAISKEQMLGKLVIRVWPLQKFGRLTP